MLDPFDHRRYLIPFRSLLLPHIFTDTLVIGGGVAGLRAAIEAASAARGPAGPGDVIVLVKDSVDVSSTAWAQGGISAVLAAGDSAESHIADTLEAGAGLCDPEAVRIAVEEGPACIRELAGWGMRFDRAAGGELALGREGGHHHDRIVHARGDATGAELVRCLHEEARRRDNIRIFEQCFALDLLSTVGPGNNPGHPPGTSAGFNHGSTAHGGARSEGRVLGAITHHPRYGLQVIWAKATILASGGAGQVFRETTNPRVATGDGLAMAWRAGATLADLEFVQFHPTVLYVAGATRSLISEAVRGEGALLVDRRGRRFMPGYHEMAELAPRDIVSRAIVDQLERTQESCVYLDARPIGPQRFAARFPAILAALRQFDLDPAEDLIPVRPCAHYTIGGVWTDLEGRTSLPGLYACGEAACTGLHGANRLASNSLLEGLVFGRRAGCVAGEMRENPAGPSRIISDIRLADTGELDLADVRSSLRSVMWRNVGIERAGPKLDDVGEMFAFWGRYTMDKIFDDPEGWEVQNMLTVGALMTRAARWRCETRGTHARTDCPLADDAFRVHAQWVRGEEGPALRSVAEPQRCAT